MKTKSNSENNTGLSPSERAIIAIITAPNTAVAAAEVLHHLAFATGDRSLDRAADRLSGAAGEGLPRREMAAHAKEARKAEMLAEVTRLEAAGVRGAYRRVAEVYAADAADQVSVDTLERNLRRWKANTFGQCPEKSG